METMNPLIENIDLFIAMLEERGIADNVIPGKLGITYRSSLNRIKEELHLMYKDVTLLSEVEDIEQSFLRPDNYNMEYFMIANELRWRIKKEWKLYYSVPERYLNAMFILDLERKLKL